MADPSDRFGADAAGVMIAIETPETEDVAALLTSHVAEARALTPSGYSFALPVDALMADDITFWTAREAGVLLGVAALKDLGDGTGEVKSMRTAPEHLRKGVADKTLEELIRAARGRGFTALYLETGTTDAYLAARGLYAKHGFSPCLPFADYEASDHNWFMMLSL